MKRSAVLLMVVLLTVIGTHCVHVTQATFPSDVYITTGDGLKNKDYTPVGIVLVRKAAFPVVSLFTAFPPLVPQIGPVLEDAIKEAVAKEAKKMGADAVINLQWFAIPMPSSMITLWTEIIITGTAVKIKK